MGPGRIMAARIHSLSSTGGEGQCGFGNLVFSLVNGTVVSLGDCIDNFGQFAFFFFFFNPADCWLSSWGTIGSAKFLMLL